MGTSSTRFCNYPNCERSIRQDNQIGRCREHRYPKQRTCSHPHCNNLIRGGSCSGLCSEHRNTNHARDSRVNNSVAHETESAELGPGLISIAPYSTVPTLSSLPSTSTPGSSLILRDHDTATIYALDQVEDTTEHKSQTVKLMDAVELEPVAVIDDDGVEENLMGKSPVIRSLQSKQKRGLKLTIIPSPKKIKVEDISQRLVMPIDLDIILRNNWLFRPQMRFFAAKALAGAILVDPTSCTAIMINSIEVYGRSSLVDAHHERCINKKGIASLSTNPPAKGRYNQIWAISIKENDGTKLNIATKTFNALVTSSIRLDAKHTPELGPTTSKFVINKEHGCQVQIFLDITNYHDATKIALDDHASNIQDVDILQQLRQPQTIFTYCTFDNGAPDSDGRLASPIFAHVASEVIRKKDDAVLEKRTVLDILKQCKSDGRVAKVIADIHALFPRGCASIHILNNFDLSNILNTLAHNLSSYLSSANNTIADEIENLF
ncbi:hypothetical protein BDB00DRAFT_931164 [Zychaea mexicana]|uniref:uncharacterized protein n=1 Tax=Zychaea mexicana TaxID=64656 RepID=UPI0022FEF28D|nr:uncharacterized protein BDB00DRAFT_931164 [Zychaea mexicana]KAI9490511.1 hypothetical protein BDB00DRAFT_931164 [Zychaea mexicana]